ncbi:nucleotide disphospho-sugar-binding domain-containing protein [Amycolatopsis sp. SID8362]|uniref:nucleotide disphospho-sugar-binding domain-containing protein n=1 Tax=Amycolatopsis sp. SID8362 TaxID=2690346 RepID=UPI00136B839F|nr:nucleotide disphospho-sugar-binding domain-containing protein [Amycolatopsis sp. SID8362]NBH09626.1 DUF1205 domain-containing protein [Amycolatopsis sp. SID8362]NED46318.1 DUF1205 domain-containing protein [Amycolatopsis sp. SID8362]
MRVAFALWPNPVHLYPMVPLAWALRAAGHEVYVVSHPALATVATNSGLPFVPVCDEAAMPVPMGPGNAYTEERAKVELITTALDLPEAARERWNIFSQFLLPSMWDFNPYQGDAANLPAMDGLVEFFRGWRPDLVIWDPCFAGAGVAARAVGARHARYTGPDFVGWCLDTFEEITGRPGAPAVDNPLAETIRPMAEKYGVPVDRETMLGQWTLNPMPAAINWPVDTTMVPVRWIPHANAEVIPDWLYPLPDRPRVALSLGLSMRNYMTTGWEYVEVLLEALGGLDIEVIATLNEKQLGAVSRVPDNVRVVDYVPLDQLMPTCSALIHHGGFGTTIAAATSRVPQLVVDFLEEDVTAVALDGGVAATRYVVAPTTVGFVSGPGAGDVIDLSRPSVEAIRAQVTRVLTEESFRDGTDRLYGDLLTAPSPTDVVAQLEKLAQPSRFSSRATDRAA